MNKASRISTSYHYIVNLIMTANLLFNRFVLNGLQQANEILGEEIFNLNDWRVIGEYVYDGEGGRHQAFYAPIKDVYYKDIHFKAGERVQIEQSLKYSAEETAQLWRASELKEVARWSASSEAYSTSRPLFSGLSIFSRYYVKCQKCQKSRL